MGRGERGWWSCWGRRNLGWETCGRSGECWDCGRWRKEGSWPIWTKKEKPTWTKKEKPTFCLWGCLFWTGRICPGSPDIRGDLPSCWTSSESCCSPARSIIPESTSTPSIYPPLLYPNPTHTRVPSDWLPNCHNSYCISYQTHSPIISLYITITTLTTLTVISLHSTILPQPHSLYFLFYSPTTTLKIYLYYLYSIIKAGFKH